MKTVLLSALLLVIFNSVRSQTVAPDIDTMNLIEKVIPPHGVQWRDPEFPGGLEKFKQYIKNNLRWPPNSKGIEGRVMVTFIIETDGSLTYIKVSRGLSPEFDKEAIRLIRECPRWKPAIRYGKPVRVGYSIPIIFKLNNEFYK